MLRRFRVHRSYMPFVTVALAFVITACGSNQPPKTIQITDSSASLAAGETEQLQASETAFLVTSDVTSQAAWSSSDTAAATVSSSGLVTGVAAGIATITGTFDGVAGSVTLSIGKPAVSGIAVTPSGAALSPGATQAYVATASYANHTSGVVTTEVTWSVLPAAIARISASGLLTAIAPGTFEVSAGYGSGVGSLSQSVPGSVNVPTLKSLAVRPATVNINGGATQQFSAIGTYSDARTVDLSARVTWASNNTAVLTLDANGLATTQAVSSSVSVTVTATLASGTSSFNAQAVAQVVPAAALTSLVVQPTSSSIANGTAEPHTATAYYADGSQSDVSNQVVWSVSKTTTTTDNSVPGRPPAGKQPMAPANGVLTAVDTSDAVINVSQSGVDTARSPGTGIVQATLGTTTGLSTVIVTPATIQSLAIRATKDLFPVGATQPVQLIGTFSDGTTQDLSLTANWQSSDTAIATIDGTGLVTAIKPGAVNFSASFGGHSATTIGFQVLPGDLLSTIIDVDYPSQPVGISEQLRLIGNYSDGTTHDLTQLATWSSVNPDIFPISNLGSAYPLKAGTTQIVGTVFGKEAVTTVTGLAVPLNFITVIPIGASFALGTTQDMVAISNFANAIQADTTKPCVWTSADPTIATVSTNGQVKGGKAGTTTVTCTLLGLANTTDVTVTSATVTSLSISPATARLAAFTGQQYTAIAWFSDSTVQDVSSDVLWNTSDNTVASIDVNGHCIGMKAGNVQVTAALAGMTASVPLTVTNAILTSVAVVPGNSELPVTLNKQFSLIGTFSDGSTEDLTNDAVWSAPTPAIVAVTLKGEVIGVAPGTGPIAAQRGDFSASTPVHVTTATLSGLALTPASTVIRKGEQQQMTVTGTFSDGSTLDLGDINAIVYSNDSNVASYQNGNVIYGAGVGSTSIIAEFGAFTASTTKFQVLSNVISSIAITPANPSITAGGTQQFTATATYSDGSTGSLNSTTTWTSSNPSVMSVDSNGLATAYATNTPVTVTLTGHTGSTVTTIMVTVNPASTPPVPTLTSIVVLPTSSHAAAGTPQQFTATGNYSDGSASNLTNSVTWSSSNASEASINATGNASALAPGTVTIQAALGTLQSQATLVVTNAVLNSLAISPSGASFPVGSTQQFHVTGSFSDGSTRDLSASATWASSSTGIATISATGLATGLAPGSFQVNASFGGKSTSTTAQVTAAVLDSIAITPYSASFAAGITQQFTITGTYSDGSTRNLTSQSTFSTSNPAVATVTSTGASAGLARGVVPGSVAITATVSGQTASTQSVTVTTATLVSITITPNSPSIADGTSQQFTATGTFSDGTTRDLSSQVVWSSSNPQTLTIDANGDATSDGVGSAQVTATLNGVSSTSGQVTVTPATIVSLVVTPATTLLAKGTTQQMTATATYTDATTQNLSSTVSWTSSNGAVASIDGNGLATGTGVGNTTLTATYQGGTPQVKTASTSSFQVTAATLVSIAFSPASPSVAAGSSTQETVTGTFSDGSTQDLTSSAMYTSSNPAVVTVGSGGLLTGVAPGSSTVAVSVDGMTSDFLATVTNATLVSIAITPTNPPPFAKGTTQQFTATGTYSDGSTQNLTSTVTWTSSNTAVFTINNNGLATGTGVGTTELTANYQGQTVTTPPVQVTPATIASVAITPANATIANAATQQFNVIATYTDGSMANVNSSATWSSSNASVASISSAGLATAQAAGSVTIGALVGSSNASTGLTVTAGTPPAVTLSSIAISPQNASLVAGNGLQYTATGTYSDGSTANITSSVAWSSSSTGAATINASGMAIAVAAGTTTIGAVFSGISSSTALTVTAAPVTLQSIAITPASASVAKGSPQQFTATGTYSDSSTQSVTTQVAWQSSATGVATISTSGLATTISAGSTQIWASLSGKSAMVTLTVGPAALVSLAITPQTVSLANGTSQQYKAVGTMTDGGTQDLTTSVTWSSSNTGVSTINAAGLASTHAPGSATINAQSGGVSSTASMTVTSATVSSLQLSPSPVMLAAGQMQQLLTTATFTDGSSQNVTSSATYATSNAGAATVNASGDLSAIAQGSATITATLGSAFTTASVTVSSAVLTAITITPSDPSLPVGVGQQLTATGTYSDGSTQTLTNSVTWSTSNPTVASVSSTGNVMIAATGTSVITATSGSVSGNTTVTGTSAVVTAIGVSPASVTLVTGQTQQFAATATLSDGTQQTVTASAHWGVSNPADATVSNSSGSNGLLTAVATGSLNVTASVNSTSGSASVTIQAATLSSLAITPTPVDIPVGATQALTVIGTYSDGSTADLTASATYSGAGASVATVSAGGVVKGIGAGLTTLTIAVGTVSATDAIIVSGATLTSIAITPASSSVPLGLTRQLTATGTYSDFSTANITSQVQWTSSAPSVVNVGSSGLASTFASGTSTITATLNAVSGTTPFSVTSATLQSIAVTAAQNSFSLGSSLQLKALGTYSDNTTQDLTSTVTWSSQTPSVGVVSSTGDATGHTTGTFNAVATSGGVTGSLILTVTNAALQSIVVTPANEVVVVLGAPVQFTATGHYSDGSTQNITNSVHWAVSGSVGTITQTGSFSAVSVGVGSTVTATSGAVLGSTTITIVSL